jgi:hypothetical protein
VAALINKARAAAKGSAEAKRASRKTATGEISPDGEPSELSRLQTS